MTKAQPIIVAHLETQTAAQMYLVATALLATAIVPTRAEASLHAPPQVAAHLAATAALVVETVALSVLLAAATVVGHRMVAAILEVADKAVITIAELEKNQAELEKKY